MEQKLLEIVINMFENFDMNEWINKPYEYSSKKKLTIYKNR